MRARHILTAFSLLAAIAACSGGDEGSSPTTDEHEQTSDACKRGESGPCTCASGATGTRTCQSDKTWAECSCATAAAKCGNGQCEKGESCSSCAQDCGACPVCNAAPSCKLGAAPPLSFAGVPALDLKFESLTKDQILARLVADAERGAPGLATLAKAVANDAPTDPRLLALRAALHKNPRIGDAVRRQVGRHEIASAIGRHAALTAPPALHTMAGDAGTDAGFDAGVDTCLDPPKLRIRIGKVSVANPDDDIAKDIIYCNVAAQAPGGSESRITPKTPNLGAGASYSFGVQGLFWGQKDAHAPSGDLEIQYDCYEEDAANGYESFVQSVGEILADQAADRLPDGYGWVSTAIDLVARYLPQLLALDGDDHLLTASQIIPKSDMLKLASGAAWNVHKKGTHLWSDWDWTLRVEAWGCVDNGKE